MQRVGTHVRCRCSFANVNVYRTGATTVILSNEFAESREH